MIYVHCADLMLEFFLKLPTHRKETENNTYLCFLFFNFDLTFKHIQIFSKVFSVLEAAFT